MAVEHPTVPIQNLLLFTENRVWNFKFSFIKFPLALYVFQVLGILGAEFSVSWSQAGPRCHPFRPKWAFYSPLGPGPSSFYFFMLKEEGEQSSHIFPGVSFQE